MNRRWDRDNHKIGRSGEERIDGTWTNSGAAKRHLSNHHAVVRLLERIKAARHAFDALKLANPTDVMVEIGRVEAQVEAAWATVGELRELTPNTESA